MSDNRVGSASGLSTLASDSVGGAIMSFGPLTIIGSVIYGNQASATGPNGRFAEGGAILMLGPRLTVINSTTVIPSANPTATITSSQGTVRTVSVTAN